MGNFNGKKYRVLLCKIFSHHFNLFIPDFLSSNNHSNNQDNGSSSNNGQKEMDISTPYNTIHVTHVGFDSETGEFTGLPREWHILLNQSGITKQEQEKNPQVKIMVIIEVSLDYTNFFFFYFRL